MKFRPIIPLILLAVQSLLAGSETDTLSQKGQDALASGLWEIAALHFSEALADPDLPESAKADTAIRLAEARIREGKPSTALKLLNESFVAKHPETAFWKGLALVGLGRFSEATDSLSSHFGTPDAPHRNETGFTIANLQLSLGNPQAALDVLNALTRDGNPDVAAKARLDQVRILIDLGRTAEAREIMPDPSAVALQNQALAVFLDAHLLLAEDRPLDAAAAFQNLIDQPQGQPLRRYHAAAVGLADALDASGQRDAAALFIFDFIQDQPESPELNAFFKRLLEYLPESPSPNDPILDRLSEWITPSSLPATGLIATLDSSTVAAWPTEIKTNDLLAFAIYTRAIGLHRVGTPEAIAEARALLTRFRMENPDHFLANRALLQSARWKLDDGAIDLAFAILDGLREDAKSPQLRGQAAFLKASSAYNRGDPEEAIELFDEAAASLTAREARAANLNAAIIRLGFHGGPTTAAADVAVPEDPDVRVDLELERALSDPDSTTSKTALEEFLTQHPEHPRTPEARLAAAERSLVGTRPDLSYAAAQLEILTAEPETSANLGLARIALVKLRMHDLANDHDAAIATARTIIENFPGDPAANEASLVLGRSLFQTRNYNDARLVLEKLAASDTDADRAQAAWLLAARSAALVPTSQSQQEALPLFDHVIKANRSLAPVAMLEKARLMIDMNRLEEATAFLREWYDSLTGNDPLHLPAGLLLGEAIYAQGATNPDSLTQALAVYDELLAHTAEIPSIFNRIQYLRGKTLEQIPDEENPSQKREKQAFTAYYSALEAASPPTEWYYLELCGFRALALLEKAGRWPAAIACAKKIASFKGPRADEAATRASELQLKHMIWED